jgi:hypothetical protein
MEWLILLLALIILGLERNRRRQPYPRSRTAGSSDIHDRDLERLTAELRAVADRES